MLVFAGLRGVIALALALDVKLTLEDDEEYLVKFQDRVMFHVALLVFLTIFVNGTLMKTLVRSLGLLDIPEPEVKYLRSVINYLNEATRCKMEGLKGMFWYLYVVYSYTV